MLKRLFLKIEEIYVGWRNYLFSSNDVIEKEAKRRLKICEDCWWHSKHHITPLRIDVHCTNCGCTLGAKVRNLKSECPEGKWEK